MNQYRIGIEGSVDLCRTEAWIEWWDGKGFSQEIATVFDTKAGWQLEIHDEEFVLALGKAFDEAVGAAKERLKHYVNRLGENPPTGLTPAGLSIWLLEEDDGTAMGVPIR